MALQLILIKKGIEGKEIVTFASVHSVMFSSHFPSEEEIIFPETYQGYPLTHLGYKQDKIDEHVRYHDYHHPAQGYGDVYPTEFFPSKDLVGSYFPDNLKRIFIPKTVKYIASTFFEKIPYCCPNVIIEIDKENPYYEVIDNKILEKK